MLKHNLIPIIYRIKGKKYARQETLRGGKKSGKEEKTEEKKSEESLVFDGGAFGFGHFGRNCLCDG